MLVLTLAVAAWLVLFRIRAALAVTMLIPMLFTAVSLKYRKWKPMFWLPMIMASTYVICGLLGRRLIREHEMLVAMCCVSALAIGITTVAKIRIKYRDRSSAYGVLFDAIVLSVVFGTLVGLSIGGLWFVFSVAMLAATGNANVDWIAVLVFGSTLSLITGAVIGVLMSIPLCFICQALVRRDIELKVTCPNNLDNY